MGILDRLKRPFYRQEAQQTYAEWSTSKNDPPTFTSILRTSTDVQNVDHLHNVARYDPLGRFVVHKIGENAIDDWFKIVDKDGNEILPEAQKELLRLDAKYHITQAVISERALGWSFLQVGKERQFREDGVENINRRIANLDVFSRKDCKVVKYDSAGQPSWLEIKVNVGVGQGTNEIKKQYPAKDFIIFATRPYDRTYKGDPALVGVWEDLTIAREMIYAITFWYRKAGFGILAAHLEAQKTLTTVLKAALDTYAENVNVSRMVVIESPIEKLEWIGPAGGATSFAADFRIVLERIAAGTGLPLDIIIGLTAGSITGSEVNVKSLYQTISGIQQSIEKYIRDLLARLGYVSEYFIEWNTRFVYDAVQQAQIDFVTAQTLGMSTWMTPNEKRAAVGMEPREDGNELAADWSKTFGKEENSPEEEEQNRNPDGEQL